MLYALAYLFGAASMFAFLVLAGRYVRHVEERTRRASVQKIRMSETIVTKLEPSE